MNIFNRREVFLTRDAAALRQMTEKLAAAGITCTVKTNSLANTGRGRGMPGINAAFAYEYRVYVHKSDLEEARCVLR